MEKHPCVFCGGPTIKCGGGRQKCKNCQKSTNIGASPPEEAAAVQVAKLQAKISELQLENRELKAEAVVGSNLRNFIHSLKPQPVPQWVVEKGPAKQRGTPTLFLSDLHWGEKVYSKQVNGVNSYDIETARTRLKHVTETAIKLLRDELSSPDYPGIVCALGGDMICGNIHEELRENADGTVLEQCADVERHVAAAINTLAEEFGRVFVPCVVGNHGRLDKKPRAKNGVTDNLEWLIYEFLRKRFADDNRVTVVVPSSFDCLYKVQGWSYLLTHGDQFRGGTGITGPLLPWKRGDQKKRQVYEATDQPYDVLIMGHWHQAAMLPGTIIVNGSLKGYDEYSFRSGYEFQPPQQTLWITDPKHGIWYWQPVDASDAKEVPTRKWVEVAA